MTQINDIFTMKIHEIISFDTYEILRVPGGWMYTRRERISRDTKPVMTSAFVPDPYQEVVNEPFVVKKYDGPEQHFGCQHIWLEINGISGAKQCPKCGTVRPKSPPTQEEN